MTVEAYKIGVSLVADATQVVGPVGEMIRALGQLASAQKDAQMGFNNMVSSLGGARRLTAGMASDMERAARAARTIASASSKFRVPVAPQTGESGGDLRRLFRLRPLAVRVRYLLFRHRLPQLRMPGALTFLRILLRL